MPIRLPSISWAAVRWLVVIAVLASGALTWPRWWPRVSTWVQATSARFRAVTTHDEHAGHGDAHGSHAPHAGHSAEHSIDVSPQARQNLGLTAQYLKPVAKSTFRRSIRVPAVIVEQPGRTHIQVATPMTAIVTRLHVVSGQAVEPGQLLFTLRLTHEDLVTSQTEFLKALGETDVEKLELDRLQKVTPGAIPPNLILERKYAVQKLESRLAADREALKLHGLTDEQVQNIERDRKLLRTIEVYAPSPTGPRESEFRLTGAQFRTISWHTEPAAEVAPQVLVLEDLRVHQGQSLNAGETLCVLADYSHLYIEGSAFERDAAAIVAARERGWRVTGHLEGGSAESQISNLQIAYVANSIDVGSRSLHFYLDLVNTLLPQPPGEEAGRFITWKYRPGQRLELAVPVEEWADQLVLPVEAVAQEGAESYVFLQNGPHFDRKPVHVKYRDQTSVVIANDGAIFPGDVVALRGAHQLLMALKNKSGGGVDPHAGHNH